MGTWGYKIFDDDFAREVESSYLEHLYDGVDAQGASNQVIEEHGACDVDEHSVFWLALATVQFEYGRLIDTVRDKALDIIASGEDLEKWAGDKGRARVLVGLERKLKGAAKPVKNLPKRAPKLVEGDLFRLPLADGRYAFGRVLTETERAFYALTSANKRPALSEIIASSVLFVVGSTDDGFARRKWFVIGNAPLEDSLREPIYFYHQAVGDDFCTVYDIWDRGQNDVKKPTSECRELEQWAAWSAVHCQDRVVAALAGEDCIWIPRGR